MQCAKIIGRMAIQSVTYVNDRALDQSEDERKISSGSQRKKMDSFVVRSRQGTRGSLSSAPRFAEPYAVVHRDAKVTTLARHTVSAGPRVAGRLTADVWRLRFF